MPQSQHKNKKEIISSPEKTECNNDKGKEIPKNIDKAIPKNVQKSKRIESNDTPKSTPSKDTQFLKGKDTELLKGKETQLKGATNQTHPAQLSFSDEYISERALSLCCFINVTVLSFMTRLYKIDIPRHVCWDETHFGKMGSWYINRTFFFDVHPPLGKMLIGLFGYWSGYDGSFHFDKPGSLFDSDEQFLGMRVCCAVLGACLVPLCYLSVRELGQSVMAATIASTLILLDTGTTTLSRYILLDPLMLFFIMLSTFSLLKFLNCKHSPFSVYWWMWMSFTGVSLACAMGVKFVGLFVILLAGVTTAWDLWSLLGDLSNSIIKMMQHLMARAACLIVLPAIVYSLFFAIHFAVLSQSGSGDGFFSSAFQSQLEGNKLYNITMPHNMAYGSHITIKQGRTAGGYLHSHQHLYVYEDAPKQQQVTTYSHKDYNNYWRILPPHGSLNESEVQLLRSGDLVRLQHLQTGRNLHSHRELAPLSKRHFQVSGYGQDGIGDDNDVWTIVAPGITPGTPLESVSMRFKLIHHHVGCAVQSHDKKLPKWGYEQLEVTCNPSVRDPKTLWNIEEVVDDRLPNVSFHIYSPSFLEKLIESHAVMTQSNSGLKPKEGEVYSRPWQWPLNYKGFVLVENLNNIRYAEDTALIAYSEENLSAILDAVQRTKHKL